MSKQVAWNLVLLNEFIRLGGLTEEEINIMQTRVAGWSTQKQAQEFHMSISKVNKIISRCKKKYDNCQKFSDILPARVKGGVFNG